MDLQQNVLAKKKAADAQKFISIYAHMINRAYSQSSHF